MTALRLPRYVWHPPSETADYLAAVAALRAALAVGNVTPAWYGVLLSVLCWQCPTTN